MFDPSNVTDREDACLRALAAAAERGEDWWNLDGVRLAGIDAPVAELAAMLRMMEHYGAIAESQHSTSGPYCSFRISPNAILLARQLDRAKLDAQTPGDVVAEINKKARSNSFLAWAIIAAVIVTMAMNFVSSAITVAEKLGWIAKPAP